MIGLLGGTFDPVHNGHLRLALEMKDRLGLDIVKLLPAGDPWQRPVPGASGEQRLAMLELVAQAISGLEVDARELQRGGPTYTIDTVRELRNEFTDTPLVWLLGMDAFCGLPTWHEWRALFDCVHFAVAHRPGSEFQVSDELQTLMNERRVDSVEQLQNALSGRIWISDVPMLDIAATSIREIIACNRDASFLSPAPVIEYIRSHALYQSPPDESDGIH